MTKPKNNAWVNMGQYNVWFRQYDDRYVKRDVWYDKETNKCYAFRYGVFHEVKRSWSEYVTI